MAAFTSNIDITSGGTYNMDITNGAPASQVANDLNGKFANIQKYLQNGLPEVWTGSSLPDNLPNGKSIIFQNKLYVADANNRPQLVATNGSKNEIARFTSTTTWTCPDGVYNVDVWVCGGGGGGASGAWENSERYGRCGCGGCGGECIMYRNIDVFPQTVYSIVVGAGGAGGVAPAAAGKQGQRGSNGGNSYFANETYIAYGGSGGAPYSNKDNFTGTGMGGQGCTTPATSGSGTMSTSMLGLAGGYNRTDYPTYAKAPVGGTIGSSDSSAFTYNYFLTQCFNVQGEDAAEMSGYTHYSGFNPYDGFNYGIGGSGATSHLSGFYSDDEYATWSGKLHGGYPNNRLYENADYDYIHGSITCGGGGSAGGNKGNYPHAAGNGGSGLIIIYG